MPLRLSVPPAWSRRRSVLGPDADCVAFTRAHVLLASWLETTHRTNDSEVGQGPRSFCANQLDAADHVGTQFPLAGRKTVRLEDEGDDVCVGAFVETAWVIARHGGLDECEQRLELVFAPPIEKRPPHQLRSIRILSFMTPDAGGRVDGLAALGLRVRVHAVEHGRQEPERSLSQGQQPTR